MGIFNKRPDQVEARYFENNLHCARELAKWCGGSVSYVGTDRDQLRVSYRNKEAEELGCYPGDYLIYDAPKYGGFSAMTRDRFLEKYESA